MFHYGRQDSPWHQSKEREIAFALLGLSPKTPTSEIRSRYLRLSVKVHPDKMGRSAAERFTLLLKVYEFLTKP